MNKAAVRFLAEGSFRYLRGVAPNVVKTALGRPHRYSDSDVLISAVCAPAPRRPQALEDHLHRLDARGRGIAGAPHHAGQQGLELGVLAQGLHDREQPQRECRQRSARVDKRVFEA